MAYITAAEATEMAGRYEPPPVDISAFLKTIDAKIMGAAKQGWLSLPYPFFNAARPPNPEQRRAVEGHYAAQGFRWNRSSQAGEYIEWPSGDSKREGQR